MPYTYCGDRSCSGDCPCCESYHAEQQEKYEESKLEFLKYDEYLTRLGFEENFHEEEHEEYQRYHGFMYEGFVEQYGPDAVYNFILVKNELLDYFEKNNQQITVK